MVSAIVHVHFVGALVLGAPYVDNVRADPITEIIYSSVCEGRPFPLITRGKGSGAKTRLLLCVASL